MLHRVWALPQAGGAPEPPERRLFWQTPRKEPRAKTFRFVPALPAALAKTGMRTCSHTPLCGVARGCEGLRVVDELSGDTGNLRPGRWGPRHGTGGACARRAASAWPVVRPTLLFGSSHFICVLPIRLLDIALQPGRRPASEAASAGPVRPFSRSVCPVCIVGAGRSEIK